MTHPITPPPEMVQKWLAEIWHEGTPVRVALSDEYIATRAAQWGADQELEACCEWLEEMLLAGSGDLEMLRAARRPKPPSLKEQAIIHFESHAATFETAGGDSDLIRRALEAFSDD